MTLAQPCTARCVPPPITSPVEQMSTRARVKLIVILGALTALGPLTVDTYLPALPSITRDLHTTSAAVGLTLTGTLIGFALGQILVGPLSDTFGRRRPLLIGAGLHIVASLLCAVAPNIVALSAFRACKGLRHPAPPSWRWPSSGTLPRARPSSS